MGRSRALHRHARVPRAPAPAAAHADPHPAGQTAQQVPPQQQATPATTLPQPSAGFCVDDVSTWEEFLRKSLFPHDDMYGALEDRFSETLSNATTVQDLDRLHSMFALLADEAEELRSANSPSAKDAIFQRCDTLLRGLKTMAVDIRNAAVQSGAFWPDVLPQEAQTAGSQAPHASQQQQQHSASSRTTQLPQSDEVCLDEPQNWFEQLRRCSNPRNAFAEALGTRFRITVLCTSEEYESKLDEEMFFLHDRAMCLLDANTFMERRRILARCCQILSHLVFVDDAIKMFIMSTDNPLSRARLRSLRQEPFEPVVAAVRPAGDDGGAGSSTPGNPRRFHRWGLEAMHDLEERIWGDVRQYVVSGRGCAADFYSEQGLL